MLAYLHNKNVDVASVVNGGGLTPLAIAKESSSWETVKLLTAANDSGKFTHSEQEADPYEKSTNEILVGLHVPGFYKTPEDWAAHMPPGAGTQEAREIRTREGLRGKQQQGEDDMSGNVALYLKAKNPEDSKRAHRKVSTANNIGLDNWFA